MEYTFFRDSDKESFKVNGNLVELLNPLSNLGESDGDNSEDDKKDPLFDESDNSTESSANKLNFFYQHLDYFINNLEG